MSVNGTSLLPTTASSNVTTVQCKGTKSTTCAGSIHLTGWYQPSHSKTRQWRPRPTSSNNMAPMCHLQLQLSFLTQKSPNNSSGNTKSARVGQAKTQRVCDMTSSGSPTDPKVLCYKQHRTSIITQRRSNIPIPINTELDQPHANDVAQNRRGAIPKSTGTRPWRSLP